MKRLLSMACVLLVFLVGCKGGGERLGAEQPRPTVSGVTLTTIAPRAITEFYETTGTIKAKTVSVVAARMMATVTAVLVKEGETVKAGQALLILDSRDVVQKVKAASAGVQEAEKALESTRQNMALAEITYGRYKNMFDAKALSKQELDQVETQKKVAGLEFERVTQMVNRAHAGLAEARVYQGFATVAAPVAGVVTNKRIELGSMAVPGMPLLTVEDPSAFRLEVDVNESLAGKLRPGLAVPVAIPATEQRFTGRISDVIPAVDPASRSFLVKIDLTNPGLQSGLYAKVQIPMAERMAIVVPETVIVAKGQLTGVYVADDHGLVSYRLVRTGRQYAQGLEIVSGLKGNETIITDGITQAVDGGVLGKEQKP